MKPSDLSYQFADGFRDFSNSQQSITTYFLKIEIYEWRIIYG